MSIYLDASVLVALWQRVGAQLATFDKRMAGCARELGLSVVAA